MNARFLKSTDVSHCGNVFAWLIAGRRQELQARWLCTFLCALGVLFSPLSSAANPLRIGTISTDPAKDMKEFQPLATYLGSRLGDHGVDSAVVVVARDVPHMSKLLKAGAVDLFIDSPFPVLLTQRLAGNKILLRRWKRGVASYSGIIFTRADSGLTGISQLKGKMLAFEEPYSTASYYLAKSHLLKAGLSLNPKKDNRVKVDAKEVGYVFSGDDRNTMAWVLTGLVSAGAMNDEKYQKLAKNHHDDLRILATTIDIPRHLVTYRGNLDERLVKTIRSVLLDMESSPQGLSTLKAFNETTRFDELTEADRKAIDALQTTINAQFQAELPGRAP